MLNLLNVFNKGKDKVNKDEVAKFLKTNPEALDEFERMYGAYTLNEGTSDNLFKVNAKQASEMHTGIQTDGPEQLDDIKARIVDELIANTVLYSYSNKRSEKINFDKTLPDNELVTNAEIMSLPEEYRPWLTGSLMRRDVPDSGLMIMTMLQGFMESKDKERKMGFYHRFRQGLDLVDLDALTYQVIDKNINSMGYWLPRIAASVDEEGFFKIPDTKIIKVPLTLLQLTRLDYMSLSRITLDIVDEYCYKVFGLQEDKEYFIKTGTYSSKYDFRNARVTGAKEVKELGEYLLYIHWQALQMAHYDLSGRNQPVIYGVSTTTEWVVRDYIKDVENNPCIYHGMPLHTEYRAFVDFDTNEVLGIHPYWDKDLLKKHFDRVDDPDANHDYITYSVAEERLYQRYEENKDKVVKHLKAILPDIEMTGQWSVDIMQNGEDFWLIDMAVAENSAFYKETVPESLRNPMIEDWIPEIKK